MTDEPVPTEDELLMEEAKKIIETPPEPLPDAADLPDDVKNGRIDDEAPDTLTLDKPI